MTSSSTPWPARPVQGHHSTKIDGTVASPARLLNYLAGGEGSFVADRKAAEYIGAVLPDGVETARADVVAMTEFTARVVRHLVVEGVRQFLYVGASIPTANDVHHVAQAAAPESRVVYVGNDPLVLAHAHQMRSSTPEGATAYVHGRLRDPQGILQQAAATLDLALPVAVMFLGTLNFFPDESNPYGIVAQMVKGVPSGSCLVIAHATTDLPAEFVRRIGEMLGQRYVVRSHGEIAKFFDGLNVLEPGLVQVDLWHVDGTVREPARLRPIAVGLARKP